MSFRITFLLLITMGMFSTLMGQYESVDFNYQKANFNNGQSLPSESYLSFNGPVTEQVSIVEIAVYREGGSDSNRPLYRSDWKRTIGSTAPKFEIPFFYKLRGKSQYDFRITYFRPVGASEKEDLREQLHQSIEGYLRQALVAEGSRIKLNDSRDNILNNLNSIITDGLVYYRGQALKGFTGFSDIVVKSIKNVQKQSLTHPNDSSGSQNPAMRNSGTYDGYINSILNTLLPEADKVVQGKLFVKMDEGIVVGYPTQKTRNSLALNIGYGGVFIEGDLNDITYGASPYLGVSLPLGNRALKSSFLSNTSISLGAFVQNFEDKNGDKVTGPIFGRPYYAALGYSFFRFLRLNVGATLLETKGSSSAGGGTVSLNTDAIKIAPFVGLSAEIDIWLGLREKNRR